MNTAALSLPQHTVLSEVSAARLRVQLPLIIVCFFLSGMSGLIYELVWIKRFAQIWGASSLSSAAVVGSFLSGLGFGALYFGRSAYWQRSPILSYGILEICIGAGALLVPTFLGFAGDLNAYVHSFVGHAPLYVFVWNTIATLLILGLPCFMMGGTLPLLILAYRKGSRVPPSTAARLYATNTAGAALGCYLAGFHLLPSWGMETTTYIAVSINVLIGTCTIAFMRRGFDTRTNRPIEHDHRSPVIKELDVPPGGRPIPLPLWRLGFAALVSGCASMMLQTAWLRQMVVLLGGSTYAITSVICVILAGMGFGSHLSARFTRHGRSSSSTVLTAIALIVIGTSIGLTVLPDATLIVGLLTPLRASYVGNALVCLTMSSLVLLIPSIGIGLLFPTIMESAIAASSRAGANIGSIYALNTFGNLLGAVVVPLAIVGAIGVFPLVPLGILLYCAVAVIWLYRDTAPVIRHRPIIPVLIVFFFAMSLTRPDPLIVNSGAYLYGYSTAESVHARDRLLFFKEGRTCNVLVRETDGVRCLVINGKVDASNSVDMATQLGCAYIPLILRPEARDILVIGLGSGVTCGAALRAPQTNVTCCEIEPFVVEASEHFGEYNNLASNKNRLSVVTNDGRLYLQSSHLQYDIVISEPSNPWIAGISNLYTREFYLTVARRLRQNGVFVQWVQLYNFSLQEYTMVLNTTRLAFSDTLVFQTAGGDTLLVSSNGRVFPDRQLLMRSQKLLDGLPDAKKELRNHFRTSNATSLLLRLLKMTTPEVDELRSKQSPRGDVNTDSNLRLEHDAPRHLFESVQAEQLEAELARIADYRWLSSLAREGCVGEEVVPELIDRMQSNWKLGRDEAVRNILSWLLVVSPNDPSVMAHALLTATNGSVAATRDVTERLAVSSVDTLQYLGVELSRRGRHGDGVVAFESLVRVQPHSATAWASLASTFYAIGDLPAAKAAAIRAEALDPRSKYVREAVERVQSGDVTGRPEQ